MARRKAVKRARNLRLALCGPTGSGKTKTALRIAMGIAAELNTTKVALLDTERSSSELYADEFDFTVEDILTGSAAEFIAALEECKREGDDIVIIDSLSHAWIGTEGALARVDKAAQRSKSGSSFNAWREVTPEHNELVRTILDYPGHVIATMRSKMAYEVDKDDRGKTVISKLGLQPVMRDGVEYEFDLCGDMLDARLSITKTRYSRFHEAVVDRPSEEFGAELVRWLHGAPTPLERMDQQQLKTEFHEHAKRLGAGRCRELVPENPRNLAETRLALDILRAEPDPAPPEHAPTICAHPNCSAVLPRDRRDQLCETCRINEAQAAAREQQEEVEPRGEEPPPPTEADLRSTAETPWEHADKPPARTYGQAIEEAREKAAEARKGHRSREVAARDRLGEEAEQREREAGEPVPPKGDEGPEDQRKPWGKYTETPGRAAE